MWSLTCAPQPGRVRSQSGLSGHVTPQIEAFLNYIAYASIVGAWAFNAVGAVELIPVTINPACRAGVEFFLPHPLNFPRLTPEAPGNYLTDFIE